MSNPRYGSGRKQFVGQGIEADLGKLDPAAYPGAVAYSDGELYYSDGSEWVVPQDEVDIARPRNLAPTNAIEQAQLRLTAFRSPTGETQTGVIFEINADGLPNFGEGANLITRNITSEVASLYNISYPDDGFEPGETIWWRARYLGTNGSQSQFSIPTAQTFPDLISTPSPVTPSNAITGTVTLTPYESATVFGLQYYQTQVEFYAVGDTPGVSTPVATVTQTNGATTTTPIPPLIAGENYQWRGRYTGRVNSGSPTITSEWSVSRTIFLGAASINLEYDMDFVVARTIAIPLGSVAPVGDTYSVTVNWGDGTSNVYTTGGVKTKTYAVGFTPANGRFNVTITGRMTSYGFVNAVPSQPGLVRVNNIGFTMGLTSLSWMCQGTTANFEYFTPNLPETVTSLEGMFYQSLTNTPSLSDLNTRSVTNMARMFDSASVFNRSLNSWDVSKVTNMGSMFFGCVSFNQPLGAWNTGAVTNMNSTFFTALSFNQPIGTWDVSKVTNMAGMFGGALAFNQNIGAWNTSAVTNMSQMFLNHTGFNNGGSPAIGNWNVSNVTNMTQMFQGNSIFNQPIGNWNTANVTTMASMLNGAVVFNQPVGTWNVSNVTDMSQIFSTCFRFNQPIGTWNVSKVTNMSNMFRNATDFNQPLNAWVTSALTNPQFMFYDTVAFDQPLSNWDMSKVTSVSHMFGTARAFNQNIGMWNMSSVIDASVMFGNSNLSFNNGGSSDINNWNMSNVTVAERMFANTSAFNQPINNWNLSKCTNMSNMFNAAAAFNREIGGIDLRPAGVTMATLGGQVINEENYSRTLIGWANYVATNDGPYTVPLGMTATRLYNANNYVTGQRFNNAVAARAYLVGGRVVSVTGASDTNANTTYTYNAATQTYDAANGWKFAILGDSWGLYNASAVLQATGSGGGYGTGPHVTTSWTGVLSAATILRTGAAWTITGDAAA